MTETSQDKARVIRAGKPAAGLTIERIHTTAGVHPYDEVIWERRDVVQQNWRTGEKIFEQHGVEFPDFWSVNASTIVTTKYFRGALDTDAREWSLKQLLDRVVKTYRAAGEQHGYFATTEDGELFEHELTWALLHQVFSFNSPVWFNVGTSSPQQVSACQPYDSMVSTPAGLVPIGELVERRAIGHKVYDAHGVTQIVAVKHNGTRSVLRVHLTSGQTLDVTGDHLVWKSSGEGTGRFVAAGTLTVGDQLEWHRRAAFGETEISTAGVAEAALAGWLQSAGFVGQDAGADESLSDESLSDESLSDESLTDASLTDASLTNEVLTIEALTGTVAELAWVSAALDVVFPGVRRTESAVQTEDGSPGRRRTRLVGEVLRPFVAQWDLVARGRDRTTPTRLASAPLPVVAAYLRSLFQADGYVSAGDGSTLVGLDLVSESLVRGVQGLLSRHGIFACVGSKRDDRDGGSWTVRIESTVDRRLFADEIGFIDPIKATQLERSFELPGRAALDVQRLEISRVESLGELAVYDIQTESGEYLSQSLRVHNCFILAVDDTMDSILNWYREEGLIFKGGSGAGLNLSRIRSSKELLSSGGTASGPVSFMRGADASAGTIKSGGATRRAAKMVVLDVDHPDIEEFVATKAKEEHKIRALRDAGFDMDLGGKDITSVQYQNANNSVRVTDEFMRAVEQGTDFGLRARASGEIIDTVDARELWRKIAVASWECADPGVQYDDTINDWHTNPETGRITASNPCFPGDQRVVTDKGLIAIGDLVARAATGEAFDVYTNDVTAGEAPTSRVVATRPVRYMVTGNNEIVALRFSDGSRLRCTPNHRLWTRNRGWVPAEDLEAADEVVRSFEYAVRSMSSLSLPVTAADVARQAATLALPVKWDQELAHYLGWITGDGCLTATRSTTVYGSEQDQREVLPRHAELLAGWVGFDAKPSVQANGTILLRSANSDVVAFLRGLGVTTARATEKRLPGSAYEAPEEALVAFLQGLFDADGWVVNQIDKGNRYVGLGARSEELLLGVQELLASLGIAARIYRTGPPKEGSFRHTREDGSEVVYGSDGPTFDLRITGRSLREFAAQIGFTLAAKQAKLTTVIDNHDFYAIDETVRLVSRESQGFETTYNLTEPRNHSYIVSGVVVANCSEYLSLDNSSCNLASLNLLSFLREDDTFDASRFARTVELVITAMDISICFADFPTEAIGDTTRDYRQLGIGYANLGALLMATGHGYDSEGGRALAASITSLMTGTAYHRSAQMASIVGPYAGYARNSAAHKRVMRKHAAAHDAIRTVGALDRDVHVEATKAWDAVVKVGDAFGYRNAQASVLAPTGCLTGDTLVPSDRGLMRLSELGDVWGERWQDAGFDVSTDEGPKPATKFFVNGEEPTRRVVTEGGYRIEGTLAHRIKVVDPQSGQWTWKRLAEVAPEDIVPIQLGGLVGESRRVGLPAPDRAHDPGDRLMVAPGEVDPDLAELVGHFMADGSLHADGLRLCVADTDLDVVERIRLLAKGLFGLEPTVSRQQGNRGILLASARLARWWRAAGFAKERPGVDHDDEGWTPQVPVAIRETNDRTIYVAFVRGLLGADGFAPQDVPRMTTTSEPFAADVRSLLLAVGLSSTTRVTDGGWGGPVHEVRLREGQHATMFDPAQPSAADCLFERVAVNEDGGTQPTYDLSVPENVTYVANGFVSHNTIGFMMDCDTTGIEPDFSLVKFKKLVGGGSMQIVNQTIPRALRRMGYSEETIEAIVEFIAEKGHIIGAPGLRQEHYEVFDCAMGERAIAPMGHVRMMAAVQPFLSGAISKTVNLPETATVEEIEDVHFQGWKLGLKALAVYRDNCKVGQPLSDGKSEEDPAPGVQTVVEYRPTRRRLPKKRPAEMTSFSVGGAEGYMTASSYPDDGLGEIFLKMSKQGSTLAGVMDAFSIAISIGLQYGVPLETYVSKFVNMRFDPAGLTDDPDVRMAQSIMDYIFRRLALDQLDFDTRSAYGIYSAQERSRQLETGSYLADDDEDVSEELETSAQSAPTSERPVRDRAVSDRATGERATGDWAAGDRAAGDRAAGDRAAGDRAAGERAVSERPASERRVAVAGTVKAAPPQVGSSAELLELLQGHASDAPLCMSCGTKMRPAGSCYVCEGCGSTSGCS